MHVKRVSEEAIEHIEECLEEQINLEEVSKYMNYSKFHFHRLFLHEMGLSVTDYIRKRRIVYGAHKLLLTKVSVTDIGLQTGFNNVDTFIRNFRDYFGVSPQQFRERKAKEKKLLTQEGDVMMRHEQIVLKACRREEKQKAVLIIDKMVNLSVIAHKGGLLSLEREVKHDESPFLRKGVELLLKGTEYVRLEGILCNLINYSYLNDDEKLNRLIMLKGILLLHEGAFPWDMRIELSSYLGEEFIDELDEAHDKTDKLDGLLEKAYKVVDNSKLLKELSNMNERTLQRVFRECDSIIIALVLMGLEADMRDVVINSLPKVRKNILADVVVSLDAVSVNTIIDANNAILEAIQALRMSNDIR